ncbi:MAG: hypothetical protein AAF598_01195 [Bacteroidota bacterium]
MEIRIQTRVAQDKDTVYAGFNEDLFLKLKPPGVGLKLLRFDGSNTGDIVHLELDFKLFKTEWKSEITEAKANDSINYFIDEGVKGHLPFFLKEWKHQHRVLKDQDGAIIEDWINYKSPFWLMTVLMYPAMYLQFLARKPIYRKVFGKR